VAVLDGDALIRRPDFRAAERAFQALAELSEWAGPASEGGRLMIQTSEARHHAVQAIVRADYRYFLEREIAFRHELGYPPFSELIKMTIAGERGPEAVTKVTEVCRREGARVLGPIAVRGKTEPTLQLLVKCDEVLAVAEALRPVVAALAGETRVAVDVDPR
jgi:primosomal protein N' (replication factor Y)